MLASSFFDPMLGIDIHWEMVPMPAPVPTPIPNPFTGIVRDFTGLAAGLALSNAIGAVMGGSPKGPVCYWSVIPATNTGTNGDHVPGHILIPPGISWAPVPKTPKPVVRPNETPKPPKPVGPDNDAIIVFGSKTVSVLGSNAVRMGDLAMSCSEPVRLPSTVVLAVPKGRPILIGGPPSLDIMAAVLASLRTRFVGDSLQALLSRMRPSRFRSLLQHAACFFTGHPVDVASGKMMTDKVDADFPGPLPLKIERVYQSNFASRPGPLGHGWSFSLDQSIWEEPGKVVFLAEDGRELEFDTFHFPDHRMRPGNEVWHAIDRLTLKCEPAGNWCITSHDGVRREFAPVQGGSDGRARIKRIASRGGDHVIIFTYDKRGRLAWVCDSANRLIGIEHDERDRIISLSLPLPKERGRSVHRRFEYDSEGDLVRVVDSLGNAWSFEYVTHLMVRETDRTGLSFYFEYDSLGEDAWCTRTWGDGGIYDHVINYDKKGHATYVTNSLGHTTQYRVNFAGLVVKVVDPLGAETTYQYDPRSLRRTAETNPLGDNIRFMYDDRGNLIKATDLDGSVVSVDYHARFNVPVRAIDPNGSVWRWHYDNLGRIEASGNPLDLWIRYEYQDGYLQRVSTPGGATNTLSYDEKGNLCRVNSSLGGVLHLTHDNLGRVIQVQKPLGGTERYQYDAAGNVIVVEEFDGVKRRFEYDVEGNLVRARDNSRDVRLRYGGRHRLIEWTEGLTKISFHHDTEEQLIYVENEAGERYEFKRDSRGLLVAERRFDGSERLYSYDSAGRLRKEQKSGGSTSEFTYDAKGRVTDIVHSEGNFERYRYRAGGELIEASNEAAEVFFTLDPLGQILEEKLRTAAEGEHWIRSAYSPDGYRVRVTSSHGHSQHIERDSAGHVRRVAFGRDGNTWAVDVKRDVEGHEKVRSLPGDVNVYSERDLADRPLRHTILSRGHRAQEKRFQWEGEQVRATLDNELASTHYRHDERGRLTCVRYPEGEEQYRVADRVGNIYRRPDFGDRAYAAGGRLESIDGTTYQYDADGNRIRKTDSLGHTTLYRWSGSGMLREVELSNGDVVRFAYDALARRVSKQVLHADDGGQMSMKNEVGWIWDGNVPLHAVSLDQEISTWVFDSEGSQLLAKVEGQKCFSIVTDDLGISTALYDCDGRLQGRFELDVYGKVRQQNGRVESSFWRWPGQYEESETGLYYNRHRFYDPDTGSYISPDPVGLLGGFEAYAYVEDVLVQSDPLGLAILYHYTDKAGYNGIRAGHHTSPGSWFFRASQAQHGFGVFLTDLPPTTPGLAKKMRIPKSKLAYYFLMGVPDDLLRRIPGGRGLFIVYVPHDLIVPRKDQISSGPCGGGK